MAEQSADPANPKTAPRLPRRALLRGL